MGITKTLLSFTLLLPALLIFFLLPGCSSKPVYQSKTQKKGAGKTYSKPTQRPYIINDVKYYPIPSAEGYRETGIASWYGKKFHGRKTANGETYDMYGETAAHKTLPMGTMLLVTNTRNKKQIIVRINDRGPFVKKRIIDLTYTGAKQLGMLKNGTAPVEITALSRHQQKPQQPKNEAIEEERIPPEDNFDRGKFYVQVGAFVELENARNLAKKFALKGRDVLIQQYPAAGMNLYRVMIFGGTSLKKVKLYEEYLESNGFPNALVLAR